MPKLQNLHLWESLHIQSESFRSPTASKVEKRYSTESQHTTSCATSKLLSATLIDEAFNIRNVESSQVMTLGIIRYTEKAMGIIRWE